MLLEKILFDEAAASGTASSGLSFWETILAWLTQMGLRLLIAIVLLIVACEVVGFYWEDILRWVRIFAAVGGEVLVFVVIHKVKKALRKPKKAAAAA